MSGGFPLTTNQDFHNEKVFKKSKNIDRTTDYYKMKNIYAEYVNAMFNQGVFTNPLTD